VRRSPRPREHPDHLVADLLSVGVEIAQDADGDAIAFTAQAEQDVLGADVVMAEAERFAQRQLEHLFGARGERDLTRVDLLATLNDSHHICPDEVGRDAK